MKLFRNYLIKKHSLVCILCSAALLSGCDWVREKMGMPTSEQIAQKREQIIQKESADAAMAQVADSVNLDQSNLNNSENQNLKQNQASSASTASSTSASSSSSSSSSESQTAASSDKPIVESGADPAYRYYIIVGTFANRANVNRCIKNMSNILDKPFAMKKSNGLTMVAIGKFKSSSAAYTTLADIKTMYPEAWVYKSDN